MNAFRKHRLDIPKEMSEDFAHMKDADHMLTPNYHALKNHIEYSTVDGYKGFNTKKNKSLLGF